VFKIFPKTLGDFFNDTIWPNKVFFKSILLFETLLMGLKRYKDNKSRANLIHCQQKKKTQSHTNREFSGYFWGA